MSEPNDQVVIRREAIEDRAVSMWKVLCVENEAAAKLEADPVRSLDLLHGIRLGAMAAIELLRDTPELHQDDGGVAG